MKQVFNSQTAQNVVQKPVQPTNITVLKDEVPRRKHVGLGRTSRTSRVNSTGVGERLNLWPSDRWICEGGRANVWRGEGPTPANSVATPSRRSAGGGRGRTAPVRSDTCPHVLSITRPNCRYSIIRSTVHQGRHFPAG